MQIARLVSDTNWPKQSQDMSSFLMDTWETHIYTTQHLQ